MVSDLLPKYPEVPRYTLVAGKINTWGKNVPRNLIIRSGHIHTLMTLTFHEPRTAWGGYIYSKTKLQSKGYNKGRTNTRSKEAAVSGDSMSDGCHQAKEKIGYGDLAVGKMCEHEVSVGTLCTSYGYAFVILNVAYLIRLWT